MAAKIYSSPTEVPQPAFDYSNFEASQTAEDQWVEELRAFCQRRKKGKNIGKIIRFPVADGYAQYMVASMRPIELLHLPIGDAWQYQHAHLLTVKEIQKNIEAEEALNEFFN